MNDLDQCGYTWTKAHADLKGKTYIAIHLCYKPRTIHSQPKVMHHPNGRYTPEHSFVEPMSG